MLRRVKLFFPLFHWRGIGALQESLIQPRNLFYLQIIVIAMSLVACRDEVGERHFNILKQLASDTALYPDFKQVDVSDNYKHGSARLFIYYNSSASYDAVKAFYSNNLLSNEWSSDPQENRKGILSDWNGPVFRKGDYQIAILQKIPASDSDARRYVVAYVWEQP